MFILIYAALQEVFKTLPKIEENGPLHFGVFRLFEKWDRIGKIAEKKK